MENKNSDRYVGSVVGLDVVLFVVFLVLKLCNVIDWSWWLVTAPIWMPPVFCFAIISICLTFGLTVSVIQSIKENRKQ